MHCLSPWLLWLEALAQAQDKSVKISITISCMSQQGAITLRSDSWETRRAVFQSVTVYLKENER